MIDVNLKVETWPIDRLIPYARNPRKNDEQVDRMAAAIQEFGFRIPVIAKSDGGVVDGHLRLKAAHKLGLAEIPVALADGLTEAQIKAFRILANKSASWADWDEDLLRLEFEELKDLDYDLDFTGFDEMEIAELAETPVMAADNTPASEQAESKRGNLSERFGIPPFSVLSARDGWWQDRKRAWIALGIDSEEGRGGELLGFSAACKAQNRYRLHG